MRTLPLAKVYQLIEPGPVVLLTTADRRGRPNVMTMSWHMMVEFVPPLIAFVVSSADYSFAALKATRECVIAIPAAKMARQVVAVCNTSGRDTDKFRAFGLTPVPAPPSKDPGARAVAAPLIAECMAAETRMVSTYSLFILEVIAAWIDPAQQGAKTIHHRGYGTFAIDGRVIRLKSAKA